MSEKKSLFGSLVEKENMFVAATIVEDLATKVPQRSPFFCTSPTMSWMSVHGFVPGTMELIYGPKSSGKTMIALDRIKHMLASDPEGVVIYVDAEMGFEFESTIRWMISNGVDVKRVMIMREVNIKTIIEKKILGEIAGVVAKEGVHLLGIVFDSVQAMAILDDNADGKKAAKGELTKQDYGGRANYISRVFPFLRQFCRNYRVFCTFIGQARSGGSDMFGNEIWTTNGGEALYHEMQYRFLITRAGGGDDIFSETFDAKGEQVKIGHRIKFICEKNKMGEGLEREGFADIIYMKGIVNVEEEIIDLAKNMGIISTAGAWFEFDGQKFNGKKQLAIHLKDHADQYNRILSQVMMEAANPTKYSTGIKMK
jgi:RecA/RadA recombinase